jgi:hypothetical protein
MDWSATVIYSYCADLTVLQECIRIGLGELPIQVI